MMTMVYEIPEAAVAAAASGREYLSAEIRVQTKWEIDPVKAIFGLEHLAPNWDGYGSGPIARKTADRAIYLIRQIAMLSFEELPAPVVSPIAAGGIQLAWEIGQRRLVFSVFPDMTMDFLRCEAGELFDENTIAPWMQGRLRELISWVTAHA